MPNELSKIAVFKGKKVRRSKMIVPVDNQEIKLLEECCLFEPWLEDNIRRAKRNKKSGRFSFILEGDEQRDVLSALEASAQFAKQQNLDEKHIDFSVLHDKIIIFTPEDFQY